ncbi:UDP-glucose--hexose-1-phosphate uridylyltransferase [Lacticaseibacillus camelliae]|uniref:Galactose-1-phosphate uridylyltransferase n=1 Tax=Lacticaseibacillus camelliae DSM 22697 = JCM 13995 TaxID=1423730 RepID=A0A0R2FDJ1_9LACO|nr:UDP-glucose--hexose-1-phosphate uridylyltransferase [Lacticaseibacillus camelliae]KRN23367.1 UTP--hexose-1-phosphate uridylyltransferase [Lacticaseibacillus camelliae DSM 22697 = JCM 13995]
MTAVERQVDYILQLNTAYSELDRTFLVNRILNLVGDAARDLPAQADALANLDQLVEAGIQSGRIEDRLSARQILEAELMALATPTPSQTNAAFWQKYQASPKTATDWFYGLSRANNYIQTRAIAKNIGFTTRTDYGDLEITINLSKPEKDPKDIAAAAHASATATYPACQLCMENEGYAGRSDYPARGNHRIVRFTLGGRTWGFQYSPYAYFGEHAIFLDSVHEPMKITRTTFTNLLEILTLFPDYFVGSNADLPIVGGSMLAHEHYQGGKHVFAMNKAAVETPFKLTQWPQVSAGIVKWPMSVIRLESADKEALVSAAEQVRATWAAYTDESVDVRAQTAGERHHTVTPIATRDGDVFRLDLVLRDNQTSSEFPDGIFHPHQDVQHIKRENIGLIEVMGLAILPARLKTELVEVKKYLLDQPNQIAASHKPWADHLKEQQTWTPANADAQLDDAVGHVFARVLEDAGVFKRDAAGRAAFGRFVKAL